MVCHVPLPLIGHAALCGILGWSMMLLYVFSSSRDNYRVCGPVFLQTQHDTDFCARDFVQQSETRCWTKSGLLPRKQSGFPLFLFAVSTLAAAIGFPFSSFPLARFTIPWASKYISCRCQNVQVITSSLLQEDSQPLIAPLKESRGVLASFCQWLKHPQRCPSLELPTCLSILGPSIPKFHAVSPFCVIEPLVERASA